MQPPEKTREDRIFEVVLIAGVALALGLFVLSMLDAWLIQNLGNGLALP